MSQDRERGKSEKTEAACLPEESPHSTQISEVTSKEMWFQETGRRSFTVGVSRRSWWFVTFGILLGALIGLQFGSAYRYFARHSHDLTALLNFLQHITGLMVAAGITAMSLGGKTAVTVNDNDAVAFTGIGSIGWRCRFRWHQVRDICQTKKTGRYIDVPQITIVTHRKISFAAGVRKRRREFMLAVLLQKWRESGH
jgi:hypothetical protein